jgi:hypothetical protein
MNFDLVTQHKLFAFFSFEPLDFGRQYLLFICDSRHSIVTQKIVNLTLVLAQRMPYDLGRTLLLCNDSFEVFPPVWVLILCLNRSCLINLGSTEIC